MTGVWVIGHECGHGGFSDYPLVNDTVGLVVHSFLLVPFFSWKFSHRRHHSNTGNLERDEVFVPAVASSSHAPHDDREEHKPLLNQTFAALVRVARIAAMLVIGWPLYLLFNATGHPSYPTGRWVNHFTPSSPIFSTPLERTLVVVSDIALLGVLSLFVYLSSLYSFVWFVKVYGVPYLITNFFLVLITYLQHTDFVLPHYSNREWDWLRGALATVDRDYGVLNVLHHHIADTHVVHHLFSNMPHYHAQEATQAVKPLLGAYYRFDSTPISTALWRNFGGCVRVESDPTNNNIFWFNP